MRTILLLLLSLGTIWNATAQQKTLKATPIQGSIKIDGLLNDTVWQHAEAATGLVEWRPKFGQVEENENRTIIKIVYDDQAFYIGGYCYEASKDSITTELVGRDVVGSNDFVGLIFDTYLDKVNALGFYVTPLGEQFDARYSNTNGEDGSWNAVWISEAKIHADGWSFEMRIPYSALRFDKNIHTWGLNITRRRVKSGRQFMWNPVNPNVQGFINQAGLLENIHITSTPLRLSFSPYFSTYLTHYPYKKAGFTGSKDLQASVNGGMDVKWGMNDNYTLDMTLIPDFGQVPSDRGVLNLSPFEVRYQDNRPFFNEGTELFNKGNLFYSRRVGSQPLHHNDVDNSLQPGEKIKNNPLESKLMNATKISGRNKKGLGMGFFNAFTKPMQAQIEDSTGKIRTVQTSSFTNYNIVVADQILKNNSSVSLINTNVWRSGSDYDANVTAALLNLNDKKNTHYLNLQFTNSSLVGNQNNKSGYSHEIEIGKGGGRFNWEIEQELANKNFDKNDMGILFNNDYIDHGLYLGYKWIEPRKWYNNIFLNLHNFVSHRLSDGGIQSMGTQFNANVKFKNLFVAGLELTHLFKGLDYYEPRLPGYAYIKPAVNGGTIWIMSNEAKKLYSDFAISYSQGKIKYAFGTLRPSENYFGWGSRYRFSDKLSVNTNFTLRLKPNDIGFYGIKSVSGAPASIFAQRNRRTAENTLNIKYNINKKMGVSVGARHYWSQVVNKNFYILNKHRELNPYAQQAADGFNFNLFNVDMVAFWEIAPGSMINLAWKNSIVHQNNTYNELYFYNLSHTLGAYQQNTLSLRFIYYLDYLQLKSVVAGRKP